ncbi:hypothetical protein Tco_1396308, partial [Tanacetum coccineum]
MSKLMKKMKYIKEKIRAWIKVRKDSSKNIKKTLQVELAEIDLLLDKREGNFDVLNKCMSVSKSLQELDKLESMEVELENNVTREEVKRVVWDCGADKSLGPNGFTFGFYRQYWIFLEKDVEEADEGVVKLLVKFTTTEHQRLYSIFQYGTFPKGDDAVFMGHWSDSNIDTIVQVLECFYHALGLRINMNKSKIIGISMGIVSVDQVAAKIGCATLEAPFSYLGSK